MCESSGIIAIGIDRYQLKRRYPGFDFETEQEEIRTHLTRISIDGKNRCVGTERSSGNDDNRSETYDGWCMADKIGRPHLTTTIRRP
ncbi:hypothetical protein D3OALGA1CA_820 [Olavius algarvensis associated proteobacterium Delta 3]|nr:hypothetical protein D3OALGA1CA_820 [Olavius algarvensis associated proteobacterium Delta 3]